MGASLLSSLSWLVAPRSGRADALRAEPVTGTPVLLCVFLRGAADGLSMVVPHADDEYYRLRPSIAVPRPGERGGARDLDGRFGLHPRLKALLPAYQAGELALLHAVGSPHPTRSHFEAQDFMESGVVGDRAVSRGWLGRYFASKPVARGDALRAVAISSRAPLSLRGCADALSTSSLRDFRLQSSPELEPALRQGFQRLYRADGADLAERAGQRALGATELVARALRSQRSRVKYARDTRDFADLACLIKADIGLEAAWLDLSGWDTHREQGSSRSGALPRQLERLGRGLAAFRADLAEAFARVVVVVMSEFGRTAKENGTGGTDHGHGGAMLVLGGNVKGGRVLGDLPSLTAEHLYQGRDVPVLTDFRQVLCEVCEEHLRAPDASALFPGFQRDRSQRLALFG